MIFSNEMFLGFWMKISELLLNVNFTFLYRETKYILNPQIILQKGNFIFNLDTISL